jgi:hypothetical protein
MSSITSLDHDPGSLAADKGLTGLPRAAERGYHFETPDEFSIFGRWEGPPVHIAGNEGRRQLAQWLAFNESPELTDEQLWARCAEENPASFSTLRAMELFDASLDLPKGTVVFSSIEASQHIKDDPPGEILDRLAAVQHRHPTAKIWVHEPVYRRPRNDEAPALLTTEMLDEEEQRGKQRVWDTYRETRRRFRIEHGLLQIWHSLRARWRHYQERQEIANKAMDLRTHYFMDCERDGIYDFVSKARVLGMHDEADFMFMTAYGPQGMSERAIARAVGYHRDESASMWRKARCVVQQLWSSDVPVGVYAAALGMAVIPLTVATLQAVMVPTVIVIDPILTFTLPEDEDRHWFIGHWDWKPSPDGTTTLVYI